MTRCLSEDHRPRSLRCDRYRRTSASRVSSSKGSSGAAQSEKDWSRLPSISEVRPGSLDLRTVRGDDTSDGAARMRHTTMTPPPTTATARSIGTRSTLSGIPICTSLPIPAVGVASGCLITGIVGQIPAAGFPRLEGLRVLPSRHQFQIPPLAPPARCSSCVSALHALPAPCPT
jgi:hypothetical protein